MTQPDTSVIAPTTRYSPRSDQSTPATDQQAWNLAQRFGFRVTLLYVALYTFPGPIHELPGVDFIGDTYDAVWHALVPWVGAHVLRLGQPVSTYPSGSGESSYLLVRRGFHCVNEVPYFR